MNEVEILRVVLTNTGIEVRFNNQNQKPEQPTKMGREAKLKLKMGTQEDPREPRQAPTETFPRETEYKAHLIKHGYAKGTITTGMSRLRTIQAKLGGVNTTPEALAQKIRETKMSRNSTYGYMNSLKGYQEFLAQKHR